MVLLSTDKTSYLFCLRTLASVVSQTHLCSVGFHQTHFIFVPEFELRTWLVVCVYQQTRGILDLYGIFYYEQW